FRNYLKIGMRNLFKYKSATAIHVLGLALGLAAFLLINQYTSFESSYDQFHPKSKNIVRLTTDNIVNGQLQVRDAMSFAPSGQVIKDEFSEVMEYTTTYKFSPLVFRKGDQIIEEDNFLAVDSNFFKLFGYRLISGDPLTALNDPFSLILTRSQALKYFDNLDIVGKSLEIVSRFDREFQITGVMEDVPENTHYKFNMLMSLSSIKDQVESDEWNGFNYYTYLQITPSSNLSSLQTRLMPTARKFLGEETKLFFNLQPMEEIHLHSDFTFEPELHGNAKAVKFLTLISLFILIIAWVNYINLSTARAVDRAKEVGLRKLIGARRKQLINQFLVEATLINLISALSALVLIWLAMPHFNQFVGKPILIDVFTNTDILQKLGLFFIIGLAAAGLYPALVLSSFKPIQVVQGKFRSSRSGHLLRRGLVVVQFAASLILIANTIIVYQQVRYMLSRDLGMDISRVIGIKNYQVSQGQHAQFAIDYRTFLHEIDQLPGVEGVGAMSNLPGGGSSDVSSTSGGIKIVGMTEVVEGTVYVGRINDQIIPTLDLQLLQGRNFNREIQSDTQAVIVNEALIKKLNLPDATSLINERFQFGTNPENTKWEIVGVVKDFNRSTLKNTIEPTALFYGEELPFNVVKLASSNPAGTIAALSDIWYTFFPNAPFSYDFVDQRFEKLYTEDKRFGGLFAYFSILAIIVASLGLFGLSSFLAAKRTKEIGIRKVLGASVPNIVFSFFREYLWLISIASIIGIPLIYFAMQEWLQGYAYHITFPWWVMGMAVLCIVIFAFLTVGYQNLKVARLNPSDAIRYE
ncbi:MAG: ABC transporter permease, partial [Saprospiraceae bacterium]|nr:ABC transporter permease [Saprospiraceae bacterium]